MEDASLIVLALTLLVELLLYLYRRMELSYELS
jgi:hypothetical protein